MHRLLCPGSAALAALAISACSSMPPLEPVERVDIERFMGDWYVIANIPTFLEKGAHNAVESYELDADGTIATTFTFRDGAFNGPVKTYTPRGFVTSDSNAVWGMQFIWPIKADYRVVYLDEDYSTTVIGRNRRDFVWIMAREPQIPATRYEEIFAMLGDVGYDVSEIQQVPQQW
ncbi:MAG: lipocalin family protein [Gammaproteobacteria bacterium]|nr:lipocalin family protein [Gammaproteobacteria bacterium]